MVHLFSKWYPYDRRLHLILANVFTATFCVLLLETIALGRFASPYATYLAILPLVSLLSGAETTLYWSIISGVGATLVTMFGSAIDPFNWAPLFLPDFSPFIDKAFLVSTMATFHFGLSVLLFMFQRKVSHLLSVRRRMLAMVSHEVRTPLHSIMYNASVLAERPELSDLREVQLLLSDTAHLVSLTNDVLDLSKMEDVMASPTEPTLNVMSRKQMAGIISSLVGGARARHGVSLEVKTVVREELLPELICCDKARCCQVVLNYVTNAIKYMGSAVADKEITLTITAGAKPRMEKEAGNLQGSPPYLVFSVADQGPGVANPESLFEPFSSGVRQRQLSGTKSLGLGLAICKMNAIHIKGCVGYVRAPSGGSVFYLVIPLIEGTPEIQATPAHIERRVEDNSSLRLLLVDDDQTNLFILSRMVQKMGYHYEIAHDMEGALELLASSHFDLMLLDYQLSEFCTGVDVLREARRRGLTMPRYGAVAVSAHALGEVKDECERAGFTGYITKPFNTGTLGAALAQAFSRQQQSVSDASRSRPAIKE